MGELVFKRSFIISLITMMLSCSETKKATGYPPPDRVTSFYNPLLSSGLIHGYIKRWQLLLYAYHGNSIAIWKTRATSELAKHPSKRYGRRPLPVLMQRTSGTGLSFPARNGTSIILPVLLPIWPSVALY